MTTPSPRPSDITLGNLGPPGSFLRKLLDEINTEAGSVPLRRKGQPPSRLDTSTATHGCKKRRSSVWVGGEPIAQDARDKLRVADEARLRRAFLQGTDSTPASESNPLFSSPRSLSIPPSFRGGPNSSHIDLSLKKLGKKTTSRSTLRGASSNVEEASSPGGFRISSIPPLNVPNSATNRSNSPLIFCDIDSDLSLTSSDSEPPTSATTEASTQASTWSHGNPATRKLSRSISPGRYGSPVGLRVLNKVMRAQTLPGNQMACTGSDTSRALGDDNRRLIRTAEFTERAAALPESISLEALTILPELSSFRPGPEPVSTPRRCVVRKSSVSCRSPSASPETPSWARSLHLVDTEVSIFKGPGDELRDNSLCLNCFSRNGKFSKMLPHGYETCGRGEVLDSHYWESAG